jgi:CheY-like chemotaxis protein
MQGGVEVLSEPGHGSTFIVTIRVGEGRLDEAPAAIRVDPTLRGLSLAVSLPDAEEACAIARYLADAGATVAVDPDGGFAGFRIEGPGLDTLDLEIALPRPWRRDALVRAVARAAGRAAEVAVHAPSHATPLNGRVLVVDDNSVNRKILARQLELAGASTDSASGGEEALELWRKGGYDLVLADLQMPTMDGFELARRIRASEAAEQRPRTPILAVTASTLEGEEQKSRLVGMDGFITKPIGIEQLKATLDVWLKGAAA